MATTTYYFKHDYNARNDARISALLGDFGAAGYGFFWTLVEMLHEEETHTLEPSKLIKKAIARQLGETLERVEQMLEACLEYELFQKTDEGLLYSERVLRNIEVRENIKNVRAEAGKASAEARKKKADKLKAKQEAEALRLAQEQEQRRTSLLPTGAQPTPVEQNLAPVEQDLTNVEQSLANVEQNLTSVEQNPTKKSKGKESKENTLTGGGGGLAFPKLSLNRTPAMPKKYQRYLETFNRLTNRKITVMSTAGRKKYDQLLKAGYTFEQLETAIKNGANASKTWSNPAAFDAEYILREEAFVKYLQMEPVKTAKAAPASGNLVAALADQSERIYK